MLFPKDHTWQKSFLYIFKRKISGKNIIWSWQGLTKTWFRPQYSNTKAFSLSVPAQFSRHNYLGLYSRILATSHSYNSVLYTIPWKHQLTKNPQKINFVKNPHTWSPDPTRPDPHLYELNLPKLSIIRTAISDIHSYYDARYIEFHGLFIENTSLIRISDQSKTKSVRITEGLLYHITYLSPDPYPLPTHPPLPWGTTHHISPPPPSSVSHYNLSPQTLSFLWHSFAMSNANK